MSDYLEQLREKIDVSVPKSSGVYIYKDEKGLILYVGKAKNLFARMKSYFSLFHKQTPKTQALVVKIRDFEVFLTKTDYEALVLENNLIKQYDPPFNILLKDGKNYPLLRLGVKEEWPRLTLVRKKRSDGALYFGPYVNRQDLDRLLNAVHKFFPLVKCTPRTFKSISRPCHYFEMKRCLAPCHLAVSKEEYKEIVTDVADLLGGKIRRVQIKLTEEMKQASKILQFEKAALLRDELKSLERLEIKQGVLLSPLLNLHLGAFYHNKDTFSLCFVFVQEGQMVGSESFVFTTPEPEDNWSLVSDVLFSAITRFYQINPAPKDLLFFAPSELFSQEQKKDLESLLLLNFWNSGEEFISSLKKNSKESFSSPVVKKELVELKRLVEANAIHYFEEQRKKQEESQEALSVFKVMLGLEIIPFHIECVDISTFQGSETVASLVLFEGGHSKRSGYRRYIIKGEEARKDDFSSLKEVLTRRFSSPKRKPDLLFVDGGTPQVRAAASVLNLLGVYDVPLVGIAKSRITNSFQDKEIASTYERLVLPTRLPSGEFDLNQEFKTIHLIPGSKEFLLATHIRNEAHRFAITFQREKLQKKSLSSILDEVDGLGPKRKKQILSFTKDLPSLIDQDPHELSLSLKISVSLVQRLQEILKKSKEDAER